VSLRRRVFAGLVKSRQTIASLLRILWQAKLAGKITKLYTTIIMTFANHIFGDHLPYRSAWELYHDLLK
jgi:hypothetical protein